MKGKHKIEVRSGRVVFTIELERNITILRGDSATGKTTLVEMLQAYETYGRQSGVTVSDPFQHLDQIGVGKLIKMAAHDGRETRPDLGLGICGEHGGDPSSVEFCHNVGLDYVSCSPFRVPIARLAAAQAAIKNPRK